jgi:hypothetical protein
MPVNDLSIHEQTKQREPVRAAAFAGTKSPAGPRELSCNSDSYDRLPVRVLERQSAKLRTLLISVIDLRG